MITRATGAEFAGDNVFRKTQRGYEEIAQETQILHPRLRRFLVFVDGVRTLDQLIELTHVLGNTRDAIDSLFADGFIALKRDPQAALEHNGAPQKNPFSNVAAFTRNVVSLPLPRQPQQQADRPIEPPPVEQTAARTSAQPAARAGGYFPLETVKAYILADLRVRMKKDVELIAPKITSAETVEDLIVMMMRLRDILMKYSSAEEAEQFMNKFKNMLT